MLPGGGARSAWGVRAPQSRVSGCSSSSQPYEQATRGQLAMAHCRLGAQDSAAPLPSDRVFVTTSLLTGQACRARDRASRGCSLRRSSRSGTRSRRDSRSTESVTPPGSSPRSPAPGPRGSPQSGGHPETPLRYRRQIGGESSGAGTPVGHSGVTFPSPVARICTVEPA